MKLLKCEPSARSEVGRALDLLFQASPRGAEQLNVELFPDSRLESL